MRRFQSLLFATALVCSACSDPRKDYEELQLEERSQTGTVTATWLSVAGVLLDDGESQILIDPFVSRVGMDFVSIINRKPIQSDQGVVHVWADRLNLKPETPVIVTHSHYDHSIDAPAFQKETNGRVFGSPSTLLLFEDGKQWDPIVPGEFYHHGRFRIRFRRGGHGRLLGLVKPYQGIITHRLSGAQPADAFRMGQVYVVEIQHDLGTIVHLASAAIGPQTLHNLSADVVLLGVSGRPFDTNKYLDQTVHRMCAEMVVPIHFDNIFKWPEPEMEFQSIAFFRSFIQKAKASKPNLAVGTLPIGEPRAILPMPGNVRGDPRTMNCTAR